MLKPEETACLVSGFVVFVIVSAACG